MTNPTTHPDQTTTHTRQSWTPFLHKNPCKTAYPRTITNLPHQGGSNCLKKRREKEKGVHEKKRWASNSFGVNQENIHLRKREGERKKSGSWGPKNKNSVSTFRTLEWISTRRIFFYISHSISIFFSRSDHGGRQFNFGFSPHDQNDIRHRSNYPG